MNASMDEINDLYAEHDQKKTDIWNIRNEGNRLTQENKEKKIQIEDLRNEVTG